MSETITAFSKLKGGLYNFFRDLMKNAITFNLRMHSVFPKPGYRTKARAGVNSVEPVTEINKVEYNPALERRLVFKLVPTTANYKVTEWVNLRYLIEDQDYETIYRADVNRIETKNKLSIKEDAENKKEEEFNHVETSYKQLRQIMLFKKFDAIYADRAGSDSKEHKRLKRLIDKDEKRRAEARKALPLIQKSLTETYEEKTFLKMMKGPYYQLASRDGPQEDGFVFANEEDLINDAKQQALRILVIGKPRAGKSILSLNLAVKLDLVHINVDNWVNALLLKIKTYEPPEDLEEGAEPPKWLTDFEDEVNKLLLSGGDLSEAHQNEIIKLQMKSPLA